MKAWLTTFAYLALLATRAAAADHPSAQLIYKRGEGAASCPDEARLRGGVAARLGYDPFTDDGKVVVLVTISRGSGGLRAAIELRDERGRVSGSRELASRQLDCVELAGAVTLAISIAVDPLAIAPPPPKPAPPTECPTCPKCPSPPAIAQAPPERIHPRVSLGVSGTLGATPTPALGFLVGAGFRYRAFSLELQGRFDVPFATSAPTTGSIRASVLAVLLAPCAHFRVLAGCALVGAGAMLGEGLNVTESRRDITPWAALGVRGAVELPLRRRLWLRAHLDLLGTLTRTTLYLNGTAAWVTPQLSGLLGVSLFASFR